LIAPESNLISFLSGAGKFWQHFFLLDAGIHSTFDQSGTNQGIPCGNGSPGSMPQKNNKNYFDG
jgi:hypothetical protein